MMTTSCPPSLFPVLPCPRGRWMPIGPLVTSIPRHVRSQLIPTVAIVRASTLGQHSGVDRPLTQHLCVYVVVSGRTSRPAGHPPGECRLRWIRKAASTTAMSPNLPKVASLGRGRPTRTSTTWWPTRLLGRGTKVAWRCQSGLTIHEWSFRPRTGSGCCMASWVGRAHHTTAVDPLTRRGNREGRRR